MKETYKYPAIFNFEENGHIGIVFPDLPGCISCGDTEEEAARMAEEALGCHLLGMEQDGDSIPEPSKIADIPVERGQVVVLVQTWMPLIREKAMSGSVKKTLTIPLWLDKIAKEQNVNYSQILQAALKEHLGVGKPCA